MSEQKPIESTKSKKEIFPGITVFKQQQPNPNNEFEKIMIYNCEISRPNLVIFEVDFTGSENIRIEGNQKMDKIKRSTIKPYTSVEIARVILELDWKLHSQYRYILKPPPKEHQLAKLQPYLDKLAQEMQVVYPILARYPINNMPPNDCFMVCHDNGIRFIDPDFPPDDVDILFIAQESLIGQGKNQDDLDLHIQWRSVQEFIIIDPKRGLNEPQVIDDLVMPNDIRLGSLQDQWLMSAVSAICEMPKMIERLFMVQEINEHGFYRVKLNKNGEWISITLDDYFPCYVLGQPIFSTSYSNELYVLLIEKAFAKIYGSYFLLNNGFAYEALQDITGCPSFNYNFKNQEIQEKINDGSLWSSLKQKFDKNMIIIVSCLGEQKWTEEEDLNPPNIIFKYKFSYSVLKMVDYKGKQIMQFRNPWGNVEWKGDWNNESKLWDTDAQKAMRPNLAIDDGTFWMSFPDVQQHFASISVCQTSDWSELRLTGKFIKKDELISSGITTLPNQVCLKIVVFKKQSNGELILINVTDQEYARQTQIEMILDAGIYIFLPQSSGATMTRPSRAVSENIKLMDKNLKLHPIVETTINEIFKLTDDFMKQELGFYEFKNLFENMTNKQISENDFKKRILARFNSTTTGLTLNGLKEFFRDNIKSLGEQIVWQWFQRLGYDKDLWPQQNRRFILQFHSDFDLEIFAKDNQNGQLDRRAHIMKNQQQAERITSQDGIELWEHISENNILTWSVFNKQNSPIEINLDVSASTNLLFSNKTGIVTRRVEPQKYDFMFQAAADLYETKYNKIHFCTWKPLQ